MDVVILSSGPDDGHQITPYRTIGAYKIAKATRDQGYSCQVIDHVMFLSEDQLRQAVFKFVSSDTRVLAVSTTFLGSPKGGRFEAPLINILNEVTDQYPNVKLIFGGYGTRYVALNNFAPQIKKPYAIIQQYGEDVFVEVLNHIMGRGEEPAWTMAPVAKTHFGKVIKQYLKPTVEKFNIETDAFKFSVQDCIMPNETLPIEISRGCIFKCKFCNHLLLGRGKLDYLRNFELLREELMHNYENWGTTNYYVICDTFNDTEHKMREWHKMVMSLPFKIQYTAYLRADLLDRFPDVPHMLKESGLYSCFHGLESLGVEASTTIGKGWSGKSAREYIPRLYHDIWGKEVFQTLSFIAGLPGDTRASLLTTADWFNSNDLYNMTWHPLGVTPGGDNVKHASEFERNAHKYGYELGEGFMWRNSYWDYAQAVNYVKTVLNPAIGPRNARHGSWKILQLSQFGYTREDFLKENKYVWQAAETDRRGRLFIEQYMEKLLSL